MTYSQQHNLKRQIFSFISVGILATITDFIVYWVLHSHMLYSVAKTTSFLSGSVVAYLLNKFITFKQNKHSTSEMFRFAGLYTLTLAINVFTNSVMIFIIKKTLPVLWLQEPKLIILLAFLAATASSTVVNFAGQKFWVFKFYK